MTINAAQGSRLAASVPSTAATDTLLFTATLDTEVTRVFVCNLTGSARTFRFFHVDVGGTPATTNALFYDRALGANDTFILFADAPNSGIQLRTGDMIYARPSVANDIGFHLYGVTADIAPQQL